MFSSNSWRRFCELGKNGGDPFPPISYLSEHLRCQGLAVHCVPHTLTSEKKDTKGTYGAVTFELFAPEKREWLNYERTVTAMNDGGRWIFETSGSVQPYETPERYQAKRIRDRFTHEMLEAYCLALGIRLFDPDFYGLKGVLVKILDPLPPNCIALTLREAQERLGIS